MRWIDLSHPYFMGMPQARVMAPMFMEGIETANPNTDSGKVRLTTFHTASHIGSHVDAPSHFMDEGATIDAIPLDRFTGRGVLLDVPGQENGPITVADLEAAGPTPEEGDIVLVRTGWASRFSEERVKEYVKYPYLTPEVADWLVERRIKMLGVDTPAPDPPHRLRTPDYRMDLHVKLLGAGILIMENLNLEQMRQGDCTVFAFPLALRGADGAPARVVAGFAS